MKYTFKSFVNLFLVLSGFVFLVCCKKEDSSHENDHGTLTKNYPSDVLKEWIKLDLQLLRSNEAKLNNFVMMHHWAYSSIALYEAIVPWHAFLSKLIRAIKRNAGDAKRRTQ